jgi:hypothetical protein
MRITRLMNGRASKRRMKEMKKNAKEIAMVGWSPNLASPGNKHHMSKRAEKLISRCNGFHLARSMKGHI